MKKKSSQLITTTPSPTWSEHFKTQVKRVSAKLSPQVKQRSSVKQAVGLTFPKVPSSSNAKRMLNIAKQHVQTILSQSISPTVKSMATTGVSSSASKNAQHSTHQHFNQHQHNNTSLYNQHQHNASAHYHNATSKTLWMGLSKQVEQQWKHTLETHHHLAYIPSLKNSTPINQHTTVNASHTSSTSHVTHSSPHVEGKSPIATATTARGTKVNIYANRLTLTEDLLDVDSLIHRIPL